MQSGKSRQERVDECNSLEELRALGEELGYKEGWAGHIWEARQKKKERETQA